MTVGKLKVLLLGDIKDFEAKMSKAQRKTKKLARSLNRYGDSLTQGLTFPLIAAAGASIKMASDFESAFAGVRKTVDATDEQFVKLTEDIRKMAKDEVPASVVAISEVAAAAGQLGIQTDKIRDFTKVMIDLGETTDMAATEGAKSLARLANITGMSQDDFDRLGSSIVELGNNMATTESEIVDMGLRLAGAGKVVGMSEHQILALGASLSSVGVEAQAGGTAISTMIVNIASAVEEGSAELDDFAKVAGETTAEFAKGFKTDAAGAIAKFVKGLGDLNKSGGKVFGTLEKLGLTEKRLQRALLSAAGAGDMMTDALRMSEKAWRDNNALTKEAELRYETFASKLAMFRNKVLDLAASTGKDLLPEMEKMLDAMVPMIENAAEMTKKFSGLSKSMQGFVFKLGLLAIAIGPAIKGIAGLLSGVIAINPYVLGVTVAIAAGAAIWQLYETKTKAAEDALASMKVTMSNMPALTFADGGMAPKWNGGGDADAMGWRSLGTGTPGTIWGDLTMFANETGRKIITQAHEVKKAVRGMFNELSKPVQSGPNRPLMEIIDQFDLVGEKAKEIGLIIHDSWSVKLRDSMGIAIEDIRMWGAQFSSFAADWVFATESMAEAFNDMVKSIAKDIIWLAMQKNIMGPLTDLIPLGWNNGETARAGAYGGGGGMQGMTAPQVFVNNNASGATASAQTAPDGSLEITVENLWNAQAKRGAYNNTLKNVGRGVRR